MEQLAGGGLMLPEAAKECLMVGVQEEKKHIRRGKRFRHECGTQSRKL